MVRRAIVMLLLAGALLAARGAELTRSFDDAFRTIVTKVDGDDQALPVVTLGGNQVLTIGFDELADDRSYLRYELVHCDPMWQPDDLVDSEMVEGFNRADITDYAFSRATTVHYVHYTATLPNPDMRIIAPGNYLVRVYREDDPDTTLLQVRFAVSDESMRLAATATSQTDVDYNEAHQQLNVAVDMRRERVRDPWSDLVVVVEQNGRPDTRRIIGAPQRLDGSVAHYAHAPALIFDAGNEYRRFETVSTRFAPMGVDAVRIRDGEYHFFLNEDRVRASRPYSYDSTQHGRFRVRDYYAETPDDSDTEADYATVHFTLQAPFIAGGGIYIDGDLTQRRLDDASRMTYDHEAGVYRASLLLKQGAYNYQYVYLPDGGKRAFTDEIEGDFYPTANEYTIQVYHRPTGTRYYRLSAVRQLIIQD